MTALQVLIYALLSIIGGGVALTRDPLPQCILVTLYGLMLTVLFLILQAPDVALSELVVGAVVYPLMVLLAIVKITVREAE